MKMMRDRFRRVVQYVSNRALVFSCFEGGLLLGVYAGFVLLCIKKGTTLWPALILLIIMIALVAICWSWIIVPYFKSEKIVSRFLDGYMTFEEADKESVMLSPSTHQELVRVNNILHSTQTSNLNKRQAQYLALQNQINPHFLYNTLEGIRSEALIAGLDIVADMTEALANFFRYTISNVENLVSVEEELNNCKTYFKIQQYRFGDRFELDIVFDEDEKENILKCRIPKLTLQPILENSIIHGTELKLGTGKMTITLGRTQSRLVIRISDNGVGMDEKTLAALNRKLGRGENSYTKPEDEKKGGIALVNVNHRIHLLFGEAYGMHVFSMEGVGTEVEITLPFCNDEHRTQQG